MAGTRHERHIFGGRRQHARGERRRRGEGGCAYLICGILRFKACLTQTPYAAVKKSLDRMRRYPTSSNCKSKNAATTAPPIISATEICQVRSRRRGGEGKAGGHGLRQTNILSSQGRPEQADTRYNILYLLGMWSFTYRFERSKAGDAI